MKPHQRYSLIIERQRNFHWGDQYTPSVLAQVSEAPRGSRVSRLVSSKLGRNLHALSSPERLFIQLALHHPRLFDLHEQKMLSPVPTVHPLYGHPLTRGKFLPPVVGTLEIAESIGFEHFAICVTDEDGARNWHPFPYQGDLLLYLTSTDGVPYAINWTIKSTQEDFAERRRSKLKTRPQLKKDRDHAELRFRLEEEYYERIGIRTVQLSPELISPVARGNLDLLWAVHGRELTLDPLLLADYSSDISEAVRVGDPVAEVAIRYGARWGHRDQFLTRIYHDIWYRNLLVNLLRPLQIDHPLLSQGGDLIVEYASLFVGPQP